MMVDLNNPGHQHGLLFTTNSFPCRVTLAFSIRFGLYQLQWSGWNASDGLGYVLPLHVMPMC